MRYRCGPERKKPKEGDTKVVKGVTYVRRQLRDRSGADYVQNGRPMYEWLKVVTTPKGKS